MRGSGISVSNCKMAMSHLLSRCSWFLCPCNITKAPCGTPNLRNISFALSLSLHVMCQILKKTAMSLCQIHGSRATVHLSTLSVVIHSLVDMLDHSRESTFVLGDIYKTHIYFKFN